MSPRRGGEREREGERESNWPQIFSLPFHVANRRRPRSASGQRRLGSLVPLCEYLSSVIVFPLKTALPSLADGDIPLAYGIFFKTHPKACLLRRRLGKSKRMFEKYVGSSSTFNRRLPLRRLPLTPPHLCSWIVTRIKRRGCSPRAWSVGRTLIVTARRVAKERLSPVGKEHASWPGTDTGGPLWMWRRR